MTIEERVKRDIDAIRTDVRNIRNAVDAQNRSIQQIAEKVNERCGKAEAMIREMARSLRV